MTTLTHTKAGLQALAGAPRLGGACPTGAGLTQVPAMDSMAGSKAVRDRKVGILADFRIVGTAVKPATSWGFHRPNPFARRPEDRSP